MPNPAQTGIEAVCLTRRIYSTASSGTSTTLPVVPVMGTGATDSKYLRAAGSPAYGTSGIFGDIDDVRAHGRDERILVRSLYEGQDYLYRLVKLLSSP